MTTVYAYIQEGGTSTELYVHAWDTLEEAEQSRRDCADDGSYRTTEPVEMPKDTDWTALGALLQSLETLDYPDN